MSEKGSQPQQPSRDIPVRRITDISNIPNDYSTTPGGSIFSTTPGGTRIFYDRTFLLQCRNSPLAKSPLPNMAKIPGITSPGKADVPKENGLEPDIVQKQKEEPAQVEDHPQFEMDI